MAKQNGTELVQTGAGVGLLKPEDISSIAKFFDAGFEEDKTIVLGKADENKIPIFFGELLGPGGTIRVETPGGKADATTGEVPMSELQTFIFNPLDPKTMTPFRQSTYTVICSHAPAQQCRKLLTLAKAKSEENGGKPVRVQLLIKYNGTIKTRRGNQLNDFGFLHRFIVMGEQPGASDGFKASGTPPTVEA
jgi:hypothetical protein